MSLSIRLLRMFPRVSLQRDPGPDRTLINLSNKIVNSPILGLIVDFVKQ